MNNITKQILILNKVSKHKPEVDVRPRASDETVKE